MAAVLKYLPSLKPLSVSDCTWTSPPVKLPFAICRQVCTVPMSGSVIYGDITRGGNCQTVGVEIAGGFNFFLLLGTPTKKNETGRMCGKYGGE